MPGVTTTSPLQFLRCLKRFLFVDTGSDASWVCCWFEEWCYTIFIWLHHITVSNSESHNETIESKQNVPSRYRKLNQQTWTNAWPLDYSMISKTPRSTALSPLKIIFSGHLIVMHAYINCKHQSQWRTSSRFLSHISHLGKAPYSPN